jgi:phosphatidylethanolamine-binding protein
VINVDLDGPFPSFAFASPILHWIQSGLQPQPAEGGDGGSAAKLLAHDTPWIVDYAPPGPPPGSAPHRYVFLLYAQPGGFDVKAWAPEAGKKVGAFGRIRYDLGAFERKVGLGRLVAANYFCSN